MSGPQASLEALRDDSYEELKNFIIETTGLAYYLNRDQLLATKIDLRLKALKLTNCAEYLRSIKSTRTGELEALISLLTIGETYFFRNRAHFDALEYRVFPDLLRRNAKERRIDIWSAGCATGPEPYSLSLLLRQKMPVSLINWEVDILATDINQQFLDLAEQAKYGQWAFRAMPQDLLRDCFHREGPHWKLHKKFQNNIRFLRHNLISDAFPPLTTSKKFDLIICRNVLIYFKFDIICSLVSKFHSCLRPGGWLIVGHAEPSLELFGEFETVRLSDTILYRKADGLSHAVNKKPHALGTELALPRHDIKVAARDVLYSKDLAEQASNETSVTKKIRQLTDQGKMEEAAALCREAMSKHSLQPELHFLKSLIHHHLQEGAQRDECLKKALYLDRGFVQAHYYKGVFECEKGAYEEASRSFRSVVRLLDGGKNFGRADAGVRVLAPEQLRRMSHYYLDRMGYTEDA